MSGIKHIRQVPRKNPFPNRTKSKKENRFARETVLFLLEVLLELIQTICADAFAVEEDNVVCIVAEDTSRMIFLKDDAIIVCKNFNGIFYLDVHGFSDFDRQNDSTQFINFSDHSCGFHNFRFPFICCICDDSAIRLCPVSPFLCCFYYKLPKFYCQWVQLEINNLFTNGNTPF